MSTRKPREFRKVHSFREPYRFSKNRKSQKDSGAEQPESIPQDLEISKRSQRQSGKNKRVDNICVCCSLNEKRVWTKLAKSEGKSLSAYVRDLLNSEADKNE